DPLLSCSMRDGGLSEIDLCCFESPGGVIMQTQLWNPYKGPKDSFTIHGLWPDKCDGSWEQFCDRSTQIPFSRTFDLRSVIRDQFNETLLLDYMNEYWKDFSRDDSNLWKHEFNKHGTCVSTIQPPCYQKKDNSSKGSSRGVFEENEIIEKEYLRYQNAIDYFKVTINLFRKLPTYEWLKEDGIIPSGVKTYTRDEISQSLNKHFGSNVYFSCRGRKLNEIWYYFNSYGSILQQNFTSIDTLTNYDNRCPATGIIYPVK
ncbi:ribonuclease T2, partial [Ascoidea rubescens DSM 1968]